MEIIISEDNVNLGSTSGLITGQIYFRINDKYFPELNWNDFFVIILGWWVNSFIDAIKSNADRFEFHFMDGPFFAEAKLKENKVYEIYFWRSSLYDRELIMTANVCQKEMYNILLKACRRAFKVLSLAGIPSSNMDGLIKSFEILKSYS